MSIVLACMITWNNAWWPSFDLRQEWVLVRSEAQCQRIAETRSNSARASTSSYDVDRPEHKQLLQRYCGPELKDCHDYREAK